MMRFAAEAARFFESVEIVELHHPDKADAPSGTARRTAELVAAARREAGLRAGAGRDVAPRSTAPAAPTSTASACTALRVRGLVAHQEVVLGGLGETLDDPARLARPGVVHARACCSALRAIADRPGLTVGLEHFLPLD